MKIKEFMNDYRNAIEEASKFELEDFNKRLNKKLIKIRNKFQKELNGENKQ